MMTKRTSQTILGGVLLIAVVAAMYYFLANRSTEGDAQTSLSQTTPSGQPQDAAFDGKPGHKTNGSTTPGPHDSKPLFLPAEARLISDDPDLGRNLDSSMIGPILEDKQLTRNKFDELIASMKRQGSSNPEALDITSLYEEAFRRNIAAKLDGGSLSDLACGLRVCAAEFRTQDHEKFRDLFHEATSAESPSPVHAITEAVVPSGNGEFEYRLVFSTDPAIAGISFRPPPGPVTMYSGRRRGDPATDASSSGSE